MSGPANDIRFQPLSRSDGVSNDTFYQVLQDRRGFLWFTTSRGLVRYDGHQHVLYPGMPLARRFGSQAIPGLLYEGQDGTLWVASDVLSRFDPSTGAFTTVLRIRPETAATEREVITGLLDGPDGTLWVGAISSRGVSFAKTSLRRHGVGIWSSGMAIHPGLGSSGRPTRQRLSTWTLESHRKARAVPGRRR